MYEKNNSYYEDYDVMKYSHNNENLIDFYFKYADLAFFEDATGFCRKFSRFIQDIFEYHYSHKFPESVYWDCIKRSNQEYSIVESIQWSCVKSRHCPKNVLEYIIENKQNYGYRIYSLSEEKLSDLKKS
jgi:hypothetical protein